MASQYPSKPAIATSSVHFVPTLSTKSTAMAQEEQDSDSDSDGGGVELAPHSANEITYNGYKTLDPTQDSRITNIAFPHFDYLYGDSKNNPPDLPSFEQIKELDTAAGIYRKYCPTVLGTSLHVLGLCRAPNCCLIRLQNGKRLLPCDCVGECEVGHAQLTCPMEVTGTCKIPVNTPHDQDLAHSHNTTPEQWAMRVAFVSLGPAHRAGKWPLKE
ncbi:hypothetical protein DL95DRAFT_494697 [Leptodontidium sp. 2 PMI_412]|nr:hypothetical protein DL95DRAFT_494697 [Leptodontidium sp. 2 PMI_412]